MASENKKKKLKNAYACGGVLKNKVGRLRDLFFFTSSQRQKEKKDVRNNLTA